MTGHDTTLETVPVATHLGIDITSPLSWNTHVTKIANKANSKLGFLRRNLRSVPLPVKTHAYQSTVRPHLEYCSSVWDPYTATNSNRLESVQHRAARFARHNYNVTGMSQSESPIWRRTLAGPPWNRGGPRPDWQTCTKSHTASWI